MFYSCQRKDAKQSASALCALAYSTHRHFGPRLGCRRVDLCSLLHAYVYVLFPASSPHVFRAPQSCDCSSQPRLFQPITGHGRLKLIPFRSASRGLPLPGLNFNAPMLVDVCKPNLMCSSDFFPRVSSRQGFPQNRYKSHAMLRVRYNRGEPLR